MAAPLAAVPWLMGGARALWPWLTRGRGVNIPLRKTGRAQGVTETLRAAQPQQTRRYTPVRPLKEPAVNPYNPNLVRRYGRSTQSGTFGLDAAGKPITVGGTRGAPTLTYPRTAAVTRELPAGYARRHPIITAGVGATGANLGYGLMAGGEDLTPETSIPYTPEEAWSAPTDILAFAEQQEAMAAQGKEQLGQMLKYGFMIAATGGDPDKFFERGMGIIEQSEAYERNKHFADVVKAVYKEGNMPKNAREAYERLVPLVGPEQAQILSGHQLGMEKGKTKDERIWSEIMEIAQYDLESAAAQLVAAWGTGRLKNPPHQTDYQRRMEIARQMIRGELGGTQLAEGVQNLEIVDG